MWNLSIAVTSIVFKTLAISKIVHLALAKVIPNSIIFELDKIKKHFTWKNGSRKIRQDPFATIVKMVVWKMLTLRLKSKVYIVLGLNNFMIIAHMTGN